MEDDPQSGRARARPGVPAGPGRILVAEDDEAMRDLLVGWLIEGGYEVTPCSSGLDLLWQLEQSVLSNELPGFDMVLSDIRMPLGSALDVLEEFYGCDGIPPTILITAFGDRHTRTTAAQLGAVTVLDKPVEKDRLLAEIQRLWIASGGRAGGS
jgi:DNA-binding NtrC family response regulator